MRKRDATLRAGESLRSSLQLGSEEADYMEKFPGPALGPAPARPPHQGSHCTVTMSSSDSYDTLASFTQVSGLVASSVSPLVKSLNNSEWTYFLFNSKFSAACYRQTWI